MSVHASGRRLEAAALDTKAAPSHRASLVARRQQARAGATREPTVSMRFVQRLVVAMERAGVPRVELLRALKIDAAQLDAADARLPGARIRSIFGLGIDLTADPAFGLRWVKWMNPTAFAPLSNLVAHAASLRHGFESVSAFEGLLFDGACFELLERGDRATVRCFSLTDAPPHIRRLAAEMVVTAFFLMIRFFDARVRLKRVCFQHAAPPYREEYTRLFQGAERFKQPWNGIVFDRALLDRPSPFKDEDMHSALRAVAERRIQRLAHRVSHAKRVREFLSDRGWRRRVNMKTVARALGLSVRSLRRHLCDEGVSYKAIENDALALVARRLLCDEQRTIQEAAFEMGFSDTTAFHRAFKRWTGTTPSALRAGA
jgi:AraC-like DNA-binding protein